MWFSNRLVPSRQMVYKLYRTFSRTGSGRPSTATNEPNMYSVAQVFVLSPRQSTRHASIALNISDRSLRCMLRKMDFSRLICYMQIG